MPSRRQIREAVVQFLYCSDLEGGADPVSLREPFWQFVTESDRKALVLATWKTIQHLNLGRENRHAEFIKRLPVARAALRSLEDLEPAARMLDRIAELEDRWTDLMASTSRIPRDDHDDTINRLFTDSFEALFSLNRDLTAARTEFLRTCEDLPHMRAQLEPILGSLHRLERVSDRLRTIERPEDFPDHADLKKIRESRADLDNLRKEADQIVDAVLSEREAIDGALEQIVDNFAPERIDPIDRAILRLATWEIRHNANVPKPVAINEAIEIAKKFGTTDSGRFVNGILDQVSE
jgi:N utilization substance protein B